MSSGKKAAVWYVYPALIRGGKDVKVGSVLEGARLAAKEQPYLTIRTRTSRSRSSR